MCDPVLMKVTITKLRQDLFRLVDKSLEGQPLEFVHKGVIFRIVPETKNSSKLDKVTPLQVLSSDSALEGANEELLKEMQSEWEKDWDEL